MLCLLCFPNRNSSMKGNYTICLATITLLRMYVRLDLVKAPCKIGVLKVHILHPRNQEWMTTVHCDKLEVRMMKSGERTWMPIQWRNASFWHHKHYLRFVMCLGGPWPRFHVSPNFLQINCDITLKLAAAILSISLLSYHS